MLDISLLNKNRNKLSIVLSRLKLLQDSAQCLRKDPERDLTCIKEQPQLTLAMLTAWTARPAERQKVLIRDTEDRDWFYTMAWREARLLRELLDNQHSKYREYLFVPEKLGEDQELWIVPYMFQKIHTQAKVVLKIGPEDIYTQTCIYRLGKKQLLIYRRSQRGPSFELLMNWRNTFCTKEFLAGRVVDNQEPKKLETDSASSLWTACIADSIQFVSSAEGHELFAPITLEVQPGDLEYYRMLLDEYQKELNVETAYQKASFGTYHYDKCEKLSETADAETYAFTLRENVAIKKGDEKMGFSLAVIREGENSSTDIEAGYLLEQRDRIVYTQRKKTPNPAAAVIPADGGELGLSTLGTRISADRRAKAKQCLLHPANSMDDNNFAKILFDFKNDYKNYIGKPRQGKKYPGLVRNMKHTVSGAQVDALEAALNTPDIAIIQGPPGTGKTRVIKAICERFTDLFLHHSDYALSRSMRPNEKPKILISSFQHEAVNNVLDRVGYNPGELKPEDLQDTDWQLLAAGIPPWKTESGNNPDTSYQTLLQTWASAVARNIRLRISSDPTLGADEEYKKFEQWKEKCQVWEHSHSIDDLQLPVVKELAAQAGFPNEVSPKLQTQWETLYKYVAFVGGEAPRNYPELETLLGHLASQRMDPEAFKDDGARQAKALWRFVKERQSVYPLSSDEKNALKDAVYCDEKTFPAEQPEAFKKYQLLVQRLRQCYAAYTELSDFEKEGLEKSIKEFLESLRLYKLQNSRWKQLEIMQRFAEELQHAPQQKKIVQRYSPLQGATCQGSGKLFPKDSLDEAPYDLVIIDEAARAHPLDLLIPFALGKKVILVGDQNQLPHQLEQDMEKRLPDDVKAMLKESLFGKLFKKFEESGVHLAADRRKSVVLNEQRRMPRKVCQFVKEAFYPDIDLVTAADHQEVPISQTLYGGAPLHCIHVPQAQGKESRTPPPAAAVFAESNQRPLSSRTFYRDAEVSPVLEYIDRVLKTDKPAPDSVEKSLIGVISFYSGQVALLKGKIQRHFPSAYNSGMISVGSVDAFQGKEFKYVILSCVRSNNRAEKDAETGLRRNHSVGFLNSPNRLCVAFSRVRGQLLVVGDFETITEIACFKTLQEKCSNGEMETWQPKK